MVGKGTRALRRIRATNVLALAAVFAAFYLGIGGESLLSVVSSAHPEPSAAAEKKPADCCQPQGGDIAPVRSLADPHPVFNGVAVDPENNLLVMSDTNRKSLLVYDRDGTQRPSAETREPLRHVIGSATSIGFVAGVDVDPANREIYAVNNDIEDTMVVFSYDAHGNARPSRRLAVPHQAWGVAVSPSRKELAVSVEGLNAVVIYRREARDLEAPLRSIRGPRTGMADPHGVYWDGIHQEIGVANHGNFRGLATNSGSGCVPSTAVDEPAGAGFQPPSITVYSASAKGDVAPLRTLQGERTRLDWPMAIAVGSRHDEILVANNGDNSILVFRRTDTGDAPPLRVIRGPRTQIARPIGVAVDPKNGEIWVANFGNHSAVAFPRAANGDVAPARIIRSAPAGTPTVGFGNPMALAYDSRRGEILVPN